MGEASAIATRGRVLFGAAVVVAVCQVGLSARLDYVDDYQLTQAIAWFGALFLAWQSGSSGVGSAGLALRILGIVAAIGSVVAMGATRGYHSFYRIVALVAGAGLALAASGPRAWAQHRASVLMLALPLLNSPSKLLHRVFDPALLPVTTWCAMALNRAAGHPIVADGTVLRMPNDTLHIVDGCSGLWAITRLFVLAALVVALFPTTAWQRIALFASTVIIGFCVNAVRIAILAATVLHQNDVGFVYWHQGLGATYFALGSSAIAGVAWWLTLRRGRPHAAASLA